MTKQVAVVKCTCRECGAIQNVPLWDKAVVDKAELTRLRAIEAATLWDQKPEYAIESWREQAAQFRKEDVAGWAECCDDIAKALRGQI